MCTPRRVPQWGREKLMQKCMNLAGQVPNIICKPNSVLIHIPAQSVPTQLSFIDSKRARACINTSCYWHSKLQELYTGSPCNTAQTSHGPDRLGNAMLALIAVGNEHVLAGRSVVKHHHETKKKCNLMC